MSREWGGTRFARFGSRRSRKDREFAGGILHSESAERVSFVVSSWVAGRVSIHVPRRDRSDGTAFRGNEPRHKVGESPHGRGVAFPFPGSPPPRLDDP